MLFRVLGVAIIMVGPWSLSVNAQQTLPTTVQLPSFSFFSYSGSALVPDSGGAYLGGVGRSQMGSATTGFGPFRNRAFGVSASSSHLSVHAQIIDLEEMDRRLLATPTRSNARSDPRSHRRGTRLRWTPSLSSRPTALVQSRFLSPPQPDLDREGKALVRLARKKLSQKNYRGAAIAYEMAIEKLSPELQKLAILEFRQKFGLSSRSGSGK
ncbi:MAG: hypothetical protein AAF958_05745 [Planctomycetota bacterium]